MGASLSQAEQELLTEINMARGNPGQYATYLENLKPFFKGKEYKPAGRQALLTEEGWTAVEEAIGFMRAAKPLGPLGMSAGLSLAAQGHVKEQGGTGTTGHQGTNKSLIEERVKPYGIWQGAIGENLSYGTESPRERVLTWLIDDGFATRGHRKRLLSNDYKVGGLACGAHPQWGTMCCLTLAGTFTDMQPAKTTTANASASKATNTSTQTNKSSTASKNANTSTQTNKSKPTSGKAPE
jgi:uncharacterized protein YkwD